MMGYGLSVRKIISLFLRVTGILFFVFGLIEGKENMLLFSVAFFWLGSIILHFRRDEFTHATFLITFFTFLLGTLIIRYFDNSVQLRVSNHDTLVHMYICLFIALISFEIGIVIAKRVKLVIGRDGIRNTSFEATFDTRVQMASRWLYLGTAIFSLALSLEKAIYVLASGNYTSYYVNFGSVLPSFFSKISDINTFAFFIYIATLPDPRKSKLPFSLYFLHGVLGLLYGQRNQIVMTILMLIIYCIIYENNKQSPYLIIKRRYYFYAIFLIPIALVFLQYVQYERNSLTYVYVGLWESVKSLFTSLGGSVNVIGHGYELKDLFPSGHFYSLGGMIDFLTKNVLVRPILGTTIYQGNTIEMALHGNSFSHTITYLGWGANTYLSGRGMGSCYIAEAYHDMGYFGVALFSMIYAVILTKINSVEDSHWIKNTMIFISLYYILYAPRDSAGNFISAFFNYSFLASLLLVWFLSRCIKSTNSR